jgi:hypothetical protein
MILAQMYKINDNDLFSYGRGGVEITSEQKERKKILIKFCKLLTVTAGH